MKKVMRPSNPCPRCGSIFVKSMGLQWKCNSCGKSWIKNPRGHRKTRPSNPCPRCFSTYVKSHGISWLCNNCGKTWIKVRSPRGTGAPRKSIIENCQICGSPFSIRPSEKGKKRNCNLHRYKRPYVPIILKCLQCGKLFPCKTWESKHGRKYCNQKCYGMARRRRTILLCRYCGQPFEIKTCNLGRVVNCPLHRWKPKP